MMTDDELNGLAVDIAANGLNQPIVLTPDGLVLDGRNRLAACKRVRVEPEFVEFDGDPWTYSRSHNLWRRNLTTGQRAAACALSLLAEGKRKDGRWARGSVPGDEVDSTDSRNTWQAAMTQAGVIADWSDELDLLLSVRDGRTALDAAYKTAKARKAKTDFEADQERKRREREIAAADAALGDLLSTGHNALNVDLALALEASDDDVWNGVEALADRVIELWNKAKSAAQGRGSNA